MSIRRSRTRAERGRSRPAGAGSSLVRGRPLIRLRVGLIVVAMVLSFYAVRLVQLQGIDPESYAHRAAQEGAASITLLAQRGDIVDRNGVVMAGSVAGRMVIANPQLTAENAPEIARILSKNLAVDYNSTLAKLRGRSEGSQFEYVARRVPATLASDTLAELTAAEYKGISLENDPIRDYPAGEVGANMIGFMGTDEPLAGFERTFDSILAGKNGEATWQSTSRKGVRIPLRESTLTEAVNGETLRLTIDQPLQWFTQRVLAQTVREYGAESASAVVMDPRSGEILALADVPTFDANDPSASPSDDLGARSLSDVFEPGSVAKVLTAASLVEERKTFPRQKFKVPGQLFRQDRPIGDWWEHGTIRLTLAGILAQSSNIGTVLAADAFTPPQLVAYLQKFGLGARTDIGVRGESAGILTPGDQMMPQTKDRVTFGQSMSVNMVQMASAVSTIANDGVRVTPSIITGKVRTDEGVEVGSATSTSERVISARAARATARMMERVVDPEAGVAPRAQVPGYLVAGKTGTAQRVDDECGCYDGSTSLSFAGFAPADDPALTVYVVVHNTAVDGGGGSVSGPVFSRIMGYALSRYRVPHTDGTPSKLPVEW